VSVKESQCVLVPLLQFRNVPAEVAGQKTCAAKWKRFAWLQTLTADNRHALHMANASIRIAGLFFSVTRNVDNLAIDNETRVIRPLGIIVQLIGHDGGYGGTTHIV